MYAQLLWLCVVGYVLNALLRNMGPASIVLSRAGR
jgi:hypothetical protein